MDRKSLEMIHSYLPVIIATADRNNYNVGRNASVPAAVLSDVREFFDFLQTHIPLAKIPDPIDIDGDHEGNIVFLWEKVMNDSTLTLDSFTISFTGYRTIKYSGMIESLDTSTKGFIDISKELDENILEYLEFFYRNQNEK